MQQNPCYTPNCDPVEPPVEQIPCDDGEKCGLILDLDCIVYTGPDLPEIGVRKGDRGSKLLQIININHTSSGVRTEDTNTVDLEGLGTESEKLKANVKLSADNDNLISAEDDGLLVKFTPEVILKFFQTIKDNPDIKDAWCELIHECDTCELITDFQVTVS